MDLQKSKFQTAKAYKHAYHPQILFTKSNYYPNERTNGGGRTLDLNRWRMETALRAIIEGGCLRSCMRGGVCKNSRPPFFLGRSLNHDKHRISTTHTILLLQKKTWIKKSNFSWRNLGLDFRNASRVKDLVRVLSNPYQTNLVRIWSNPYQTMVHLRRFKNLNPIISMKNQNFWSDFFSAERYGMSRWNPLKIVVWGPTPSKRRTTIFIDPPQAASQTTTLNFDCSRSSSLQVKHTTLRFSPA